MLAAGIFLYLQFGIDLTLMAIAAGVIGLAFVCVGLSVGLYMSERPAMFRILIGASCVIWLPVAQALFGIADVVAPLRKDETETARQFQVEPTVYAGDRNALEEGPGLFSSPKDSLLPLSLSAPVGVGYVMEGGSLDAEYGPALKWGKRMSSIYSFAFNDQNRMLRIPRQQSAVAGTVQVALRYRVFSPLGREPLFPADGRYHRIKRLGSCRLAPGAFTQLQCVGAVYSPCFGFERHGRNTERPFQTLDYCPPDRALQYIRWPLPYAFSNSEFVQKKNVLAATIWRKDRVERRFAISEAEFQRRLISPATVYGSDTATKEP